MFDKRKTAFLILCSLYLVSAGLLTSISLMVGFHLLMIPAIFLCAKNYDWKKFPRSGWALVAFAGVLIVSVVVNHNIVARPMKNIFKVKYYLLGAFSIIPLQFYFQEYLSSEKKQKVLRKLLITLLITSSAATISGFIGYLTGFNPLRMAEAIPDRNGGLFGMLITYAHSIAWLSVLLVGMCLNHKRFEKIISYPMLLSFTLLSVMGLFTSYTRGAWIAFLAGCICMNKKVASTLVAVGLVGVVVMAWHDPKFLDREMIRRGSNQERLGAVIAAAKAFQEKPLLGFGYLNFEPYSKEIKVRYQLPKPDFGGHAHNDLLEILATSGILGGLFLLLWIVLWVREIQKRGGLTQKIVLPFIVTFLISGMTHVSLNDGENAFFLMMVYALSEVL